MTRKQWKKGFLSSGFPLEFETAKVLAKHGFAVDPEFRYERLEAGQTKEFSVDLHSTLYFPTSNSQKITAALELLMECKYRTPNMTWVFLPDPNRPGFSLGTLGYTIRAIDEFSFCQVPSEPICDLERNAFCYYKGTEINLSNGQAHDSEIRHGINQLQYALPHLISEKILFNVFGLSVEIIPFFVLPILVTTAELRVLRRGMTLRKVENIRILEEITQKVPYLILFDSFGPNFVAHAKLQFKQLVDLNNCDNVREIEKRLRESGFEFYEHLLPLSLGKALTEGDLHTLERFCSQFLVCSFDELPKILTLVKQLIRSCLRKRKTF